MKNVLKCIILLFVFNFQLIASEIDVQNTIIKLNTNYISIGQLINEIEKQTRYYVIYSNQEVDSETKVYIQNKSENLTSCLQQAFEKSNISFEIDNNYIILTKKNVLTKDVNKIQQGNKQIKGVVIDVNGESLIGVNVYEKGSTTNGTSTDINGNFTINVPDGSTLVISYVGFITQEIVVDEIARDTSLTVTLIEDSKSLEEVVVIGYGTMSKKNVSGSIDYYIKNTKDLLYRYAVPVPPYLYNRMLANVGDMSNKGIEIVLNGGIIEQKDFNWNVSVNFAHNKNKVVRLSNDIYQTDRILLGGLPVARGVGNVTTHILEEGQAVGTYYNYKHLGISEDGNFIIWDKDENGIINPNDYTYLGCAQPKFTYGIQNTFRYKRFDLSFFFRGVNGNKVINTPKLQYGTDRWLPGMNIFREAMNNPINRAYRFSDYYLEDGSFLRLDNAVVGYSFNLNKTLGINKFRLYVSGQNLLLITKFGGLDPEISMDGLSPGALNTAYIPRPRTLTFGVNLSF